MNKIVQYITSIMQALPPEEEVVPVEVGYLSTKAISEFVI